jgi:hypothetical protein
MKDPETKKMEDGDGGKKVLTMERRKMVMM